MALPEYFARNALAAAQAISGLDEQRLTAALDETVIGISVGTEVSYCPGATRPRVFTRYLENSILAPIPECVHLYISL